MAISSPVSVTPQTINPVVGAEVTLVAANATNGHKFANDGQTRLFVKTGSTTATLTVEQGRLVNGKTVASVTLALAANKEYLIGPFPKQDFDRDPSLSDAGYVYFGFSADTNIYWALVR